jgi:hypothetical protein
MRKSLSLAVAGTAVLATSSLLAQVVNPGVVGPARRAAAAAGNTAGAPGVEQRIENREQARDVVRAENGNPNAAARADARANDQWRFKYHNNQWWYYTPQNNWVYHTNNAWQNYDANTYVAPTPRYTTGYRGTTNNGYYNNNNGYNNNRRFFRGRYGPATTPYSNGTPAGNAGSNLGAEIGAAANGQAGANTGAAVGGAIGNTIGAGNQAPAPPVEPAAPVIPVP